MTTCGSLSSLFENPLPENPSLIESLSSWNRHKPVEASSFAEIFGELYFQEKPSSESHIPSRPLPLAPPIFDQCSQSNILLFEAKDVQTFEKPLSNFILDLPKNQYRSDTKCNGSFSTMNSESLQLCTEGLGSESSDDVDDMLDSGDDWRSCGEGRLEVRRRPLMYGGFNGYLRGYWDVKASKSVREFPPPISSIGRNGKPCVCLKSYREDGRFVLREIRIPSQEFLRASREDGRLKLHFVHPDDDIDEGEDEQELDEREEQEEDDEVEKVSEEQKIRM